MASVQRELTKYGKGILAHRMRIPMELLKTLELPLPPKKEQDQIIRFFANKLLKINKFIKNKKKVIQLLSEQKRVVINQAVTKGLNPNVKMKPSGIEWLGNIPEQWNICRCRYLFYEFNTRSITGEETHLSMSQKYGLVPDDLLTERRLFSENYIGGKLCEENDLVLNRLKAHLGVFALSPQDGVISPDYTVLRPNSLINPKYSELVLKSESCRRELSIRVRGIVEGFWRLYTEDFNNTTLPLPSIEEQQQIVCFVDKQIKYIEKMIKTIQKEIDLVSEYRVSLISDVVTGKVDVRNIEVAEVLEEEILEDEEFDEGEED